MSGWGRLGLVPREVGSIGSIPAKTGLHQDKMRNKSRINEKLAQGQVFITSAGGKLGRYVIGIDREPEDVPLGDPHVLQQPPGRVWQPLRPDPAQFHGQIGNRRLEVKVGMAALKQLEQVFPQCLGAHAGLLSVGPWELNPQGLETKPTSRVASSLSDRSPGR